MIQGKKVLDRINRFFISAFRKKKRSCTILKILSDNFSLRPPAVNTTIFHSRLSLISQSLLFHPS